MEKLTPRIQNERVPQEALRPARLTSSELASPTGGYGEQASQTTLKDYQETFSSIYRLYGLDAHALKLGFLESVMLLHATMRQLTGPFINTRLRRIFTDSPVASTLGEAKKFGAGTNGDGSAFMKEAGKLALIVCGTLVGELSATLLDGAARKAFEKEALSIRRAINDRVASSVFMRDFEFMHDKTPTEILNILDRGKQATMDIISTTYTEIIPHLTSIVAASSAGFNVDWRGGTVGMLRLPLLYWTNKSLSEQILADRRTELRKKDAVDTSVMNSLQSIEAVKSSETMEESIRELGNAMQERDEIITESTKKHISRRQQEAYFDTLFEEIIPLVLGYIDLKELVKSGTDPAASGLMAYNQYRTIGYKQRSIGGHATALMRVFLEKIQPALQDVRRMEEFLGPYDLLDKPVGPLEHIRIPVDAIGNFDIRVSHLDFKDILYGVSLDIPQGSFVTIRGPSGAGKTTLLRHLLGLYGASEGVVLYGGVDLSKIKKFGEQSLYTKLAYANQNPQYFENRTLRDNLLLWTKQQVSDAKVLQVLHDLKLDHIADRLDSTAKHFSGGELRRIGIARALLKDPNVLFLDEPTSNLDQESAKQVLEIIQEMRRKRPDMTVVAVTHDPSFEAIAEKIVDFREINTPTDRESASLGNRQVFFAATATPKS